VERSFIAESRRESAEAKMLIIGIAAPPAGGKSTVARHLAQRGAVWINADQIAHQVLENPVIVQQVIQEFGADVASEDGKIDRHKLAKRVFGDDDTSRLGLRYLESVLHPPTRRVIHDKIKAAADAKSPAVVLDIPLLFENDWAKECDEIWFIDTAPEIQRAEALRRGWTDDNLSRRQSRQLSLDEKRRLSTRIIPNHGTLQELIGHVDRLCEDFVSRSAIDPAQSLEHSHYQPPDTRGY